MYKYIRVNVENSVFEPINVNIYIEEIYSLLCENIKIMQISLEKIGESIWDVDEIVEEAKDIIAEIANKYIDKEDLEWKIQVNNILFTLLNRFKMSFSQIDKMFDEEIFRCEERYNLLGYMLPSVEEVIEIKYLKWKKEKLEESLYNNLVKNTVSNLYSSNNEYKYLDDSVEDDEYEIAA